MQLDRIKEELGIEMPRGTQPVGVLKEEGPDSFIFASVDIPHDQLPKLLAALPSDMTWRSDRFTIPAHLHGQAWWEPGSLVHFRQGTVWIDSGKSLDVLIGTEDEATATARIYFVLSRI